MRGAAAADRSDAVPGGSSAGTGRRACRPRPNACVPQAADAPIPRACRSSAHWRCSAASSRAITSLAVSGANASVMIARRADRAAVRLEFDAKRSSVESAGCPSTSAQNTIHSRSLCTPSITVLPSPAATGRKDRSSRARRRRAAAAPRRRTRSRADSPSIRPCFPASIRRSPARPVLLALEQRREDAAVRVHAGRDIGNRAAGLRRLVGRAGNRKEAGLALDQQVVGLLVAIGAVFAVARNVADDSRGCERAASRTRVQGAPRRRGPGSERTRRRARRVAEDRRGSGCLTSSVRLSFQRFVQTKCDASPRTRSS